VFNFQKIEKKWPASAKASAGRQKNYEFQRIEKYWQKEWERRKIYSAKDFSKKPKFYGLIEFPYPSGDGLHVGHVRSNTAMDIICRKRRMQGYNVLYPIGWDAFGLPTENYAIKTGIHPKIVTKKNTDTFRRQLKSLGFSFDWGREINTTDPKYYKWTQWIFLQFYKHGLAYKHKMPINWCPSCKIGLANEEVVDGHCERCGAPVVKKEKEQWLLAITKYADKLLEGLKTVDYLEKIKTQQRNWIGKSEGAVIKFKIQKSKSKITNQNSKIDEIEIFTTRPDTLFGATYLVLSPEHPFIANRKAQIANWREVEKYIKKAKAKSEEERISEGQVKTGVELKGIRAINPANKKEIPIFVADYVLSSYGTGAIMAVPAHDERDFEFAKRYNLPIVEVVSPLIHADKKQINIDNNIGINRQNQHKSVMTEPYIGEGMLINSGQFNGMSSVKAKIEITKFVGGKKQTQYHLRDWIFSRQHYWGEPIPIIFCEKCGSTGSPQAVPVPEKDLPVKLPEVKNYKPTDTGESPLASITKWVNVKCPKCGGKAKRETDTMPNWAGSSWYFLRYCDPKNNKKFASMEKLKYWMTPARRSSKSEGGVDWYNGGMEHVTLHLLYSRFWNKFLYDIGAVPVGEPYQKRTSHGLILGESGAKMSKSKGNVVNPDDIVKNFGADAFRLYEMFMGPFDQAIPWNPKGIIGCSRFLARVWNFYTAAPNLNFPTSDVGKLEKLAHQTIKKVSEDIETMNFNTAVSSLMILFNEMEKSSQSFNTSIFQSFIKLLAPFAPFITEELWQQLHGLTQTTHRLTQKKSPRQSVLSPHKSVFSSIHLESWPKYDPKLIQEEQFELVIQINGKVRDKISAKINISQKQAEALALSQEKIKIWLKDKNVRKIIFVANRLINIVI